MNLWRHDGKFWRVWLHDNDRGRFNVSSEKGVQPDKGTEGQEESKFLHKHLPFLHTIVFMFDSHLSFIVHQVIKRTLEGMCDMDGPTLVFHFVAVDVPSVVLVLDNHLAGPLAFLVHNNIVVHVLVGADGGVIRKQLFWAMIGKT